MPQTQKPVLCEIEALIRRIADHSLTVFDKGFVSAEVLLGLSGTGTERHYLIPAKSNTQYEVLSGTPEDCRVRLRISPQARANAPDSPESWDARAIRVESANGQSRVLLTSLFDRRRFKAQDLADCYRRRRCLLRRFRLPLASADRGFD